MSIKIKLILFFLTSCFGLFPIAAQSLVPNNGFENFIVCPIGFSEFTGKISNWQNPNTATPDYMNACANPNPAGMPKNGIGYQVAHSGNGYTGIYTFSGTTYREFIQVQLISPLIASHTYYFSMYVVLHNKSQTAIDDLGAYISVTAPNTTGLGMLPGLPYPQISNPYGSVITDTLNWTLVEGTYIATGGEKFLTLGHLKNDVSTTYLPLPYGTVGAYYYIDDVNLIDITLLPITLIDFSGTLQTDDLNNSVLLQWSTENEINNCCFNIEKSEDGNQFSTIGEVKNSETYNYSYIDEKPFIANNYYRLKQMDNNGEFTYSNIITIYNYAICNEVESFVENNNIIFDILCKDVRKVELYNIIGQKIASYLLTEGKNIIDIPNGLNGMIILIFTDGISNRAQATKKLII
ncbi:MAG: hypothetical protein IPH42_17040 [Bacteroidetes bacterium]|nr:hypothetical protein [Bacteroidota bacterium]